MKEDLRLDEAIAAGRADAPPAAAAEAAAARVWACVAEQAGLQTGPIEAIRGCADVQALLPEHRRGALAPSRALLVEDHLKECAACRSALRGGPRLAVLPWRAATASAGPAPRSFRPHAIAAAALLATALGAMAIQLYFGAPPGSRAAVQSVSGVLQRVATAETPALQPGQELGEAESVRTARGSRAHLKLRDGSIVEMGERAELSVSQRGQDTTIRLERGSIIVQAAKRQSGRLLVASNGCTVYVTGTVFSVNSGLKGSRVSVIEGRVRVVKGGDETLLEPGEQFATGAGMGRVPVSDEIAWSRDLDKHLLLLGELKALREKLAGVQMPGLRYESRLLDLLPESTVVFAGLPNYGQALADAHRLFEERLQESAPLREWWSEADPAQHGGPSLAAVIEKVRSFSDYLGDEVAFAAVAEGGPKARAPRPFLLAELRRQGLREFIESELAHVKQAEAGTPTVRVLDDETLASATAARAGVYVLLRPELVVVSPDLGALRQFAGQAASGGGAFRTDFGRRIAEAYRDGVGLLFAADLQRIAARPRGKDAARLHETGMDDLKYLIVERKELLGRAHTEAVLAFAGPRRGVASWLAAPAPMGALDFVSPNAQAAAAFVSKSPSLVFDDLLAIANADRNKAARELAELEARLDHVRLREDIAEALGGEFAFALDGPLLPTPSWKVVVEVYDAARLQRSLQVLIGKVNDEAASAGRAGLRLEAEQVGAQTYHSLRGGELPFEVHYTFADGYLVAGPSRALVMQALRARETGESLSRSGAFLGLFPPGRQDHVSGLLYQNLTGVFGALSGLAGSAQLSDEQRRALDAISRDSRPTLLCAYGETDGIQVAGIGGGLDFDPSSLALPLLLERGLSGTARRAGP
jgi:hypothetical protein